MKTIELMKLRGKPVTHELILSEVEGVRPTITANVAGGGFGYQINKIVVVIENDTNQKCNQTRMD